MASPVSTGVGFEEYLAAPCPTDAAFWSAINQGVQEAAPDAVESLERRIVLDGVLRFLYS